MTTKKVRRAQVAARNEARDAAMRETNLDTLRKEQERREQQKSDAVNEVARRHATKKNQDDRRAAKQNVKEMNVEQFKALWDRYK